MRLIIAFALALIGLGMCLWAGNWLGLGFVFAGLFLCPSEDQQQVRVRRTTIGYRRGRGMPMPPAYRVSRGNSDAMEVDCRL